MKTTIQKLTLLMALPAIMMVDSCKKPGAETVNESTPPFTVGKAISDTATGGTAKGTMLSGHTYNISRDLIINKGDTLLIQSDVTICMSKGANIVVHGTFISLGTADKPNWITSCSQTRNDVPGVDPQSDPAYSGQWGGINCDTSCYACVVKWTHLEYAGAAFVNPPLAGQSAGSNSFVIFFQNPKGILVIEDSWIYGNIDDAVRIAGGKFHIMRNTVEKSGQVGGDVFNAKSGSIGDMAYNLFVGVATNGTKASNKGGITPQTNINMYNNTYVNSGYRRASTGRGGSLNYEEGARGEAYNNLIVNCKFGLRIVNNPVADTMNMHYGYTFNYGDSTSITGQFYPTGYISKPQSTDIPLPSAYLPNPYTLGMTYDGSSENGKNNPMFTNFPLPQPTTVQGVAYVGNYVFTLQPGSPAIGKGYTGVSPIAAVPVSATFGATEITLPGVDMGAYQTNGKGNQHFGVTHK